MHRFDAILRYDPKPINGSDKMFKPWWLIGFIEAGELTEYYAWFIRKRTGIILQKPAWGAHISIIRGEEPINKDLWGKYEGQVVSLECDPNIRTNGQHWWFRVDSEPIRDIREELGLLRRHPIGLHVTLGRPVPRCESCSEFFSRYFQKFDIN